MKNYLEKRKRLFVNPNRSALLASTGGMVLDFVGQVTDEFHTNGFCSDEFRPDIFEELTTPKVSRVDSDSYCITRYETDTGESYQIGIELGAWISTLRHPASLGIDYDELKSYDMLRQSIKYSILAATLRYFEDHWGHKYELLKDDSGFWYVSAK